MSSGKKAGGGGSGSDNVKVAIRVRPLSVREQNLGDTEILNYPPSAAATDNETPPGVEKSIDIKGYGSNASFTFDHVFTGIASQEVVYQHSGVSNMVKSF